MVDKSRDKRADLVDALLKRDEFAGTCGPPSGPMRLR